MNYVGYGMEIYANNDTSKIQNIINKILKVLCKNKNIGKTKTTYHIINLKDMNRLSWLKLTHNLIHNSFNEPNYLKNLLELKQNRNGLKIKTLQKNTKY